jgi:hypothetical protein
MLKKEKTMKKSFVWFIFVLFSLLLLFGCGLVRKKSEKVKDAGNIAGIVFDVTTIQPLSGAIIYVEEMKTIGTKTDTLGRFWLSSIPIGEYKIQAEKIYYYRAKISEVKVSNDSTSLVLCPLVHTSIPEEPHWYPWQENKVKCDSTEFYRTYYKTLLRKK